MLFSITDTARILKVDIEVIKEWTLTFSEYMSQGAMSRKDTDKMYCIEDIRVMSYVFMYWENEPDIEYIKIGLNSSSQYQHDLIDNFIVEITPFFPSLRTIWTILGGMEFSSVAWQKLEICSFLQIPIS